ncbi:MAG: GyrI-like domain-containing protein [Thermoleophilia bacterium]|nr:GyrI-like domain-containing protein [Thermoleophilia bacterium]
MAYEITEKDLPPQLALTRRETVTMKTIGEGLDAGFAALKDHAAATGAETAGPPFVFSPDFGKDQFDLVICMPVTAGAEAGEGIALEEIAGGHVAAVTHKGAYTDVPKAYEALFGWIKENGREPAGVAREVYHNDPKETPESELLVEIAIPLK